MAENHFVSAKMYHMAENQYFSHIDKIKAIFIIIVVTLTNLVTRLKSSLQKVYSPHLVDSCIHLHHIN